MKQQRLSILIGAAAAATAGLCGVAAAQTGQGLEQLMAKSSNWATQAGDYANHRYSDLKEVNSNNVGQLQVAWTMSTGVLRGHEGSPLVIGETLYLHTPFPNNVYAVNLKDQSFKWKYEPKQNADVVPVMCCDTVNRGLAYGNGKILLQQADTTLVALDANTGKVVWTAKNGDPKIGETNTNAPHVFKDKVITGISGGEFGVRGRLIAYDLNSGKKLWTAWSTGPDKELLVDPQKTMTWTNGKLAPIGVDSSIKTWKGDQWKLGGGTTWGWFSYDPKLNLVYYGTGNPGTWNPAQRPGDNRWSMTLFARDLDTGMAKWAYQMTPHDEWDFDGVNENLLVDLTIKGKKVPSLVHFDRNGFGYTLNRETGELLVAQKFDPKVNWASSVDMKTGRPIVDKKYSPGTTGSGRQREGHLSGRARLEGSAAGELRPQVRPDHGADESRLHDVRAVPGRVHRRSAVRRRDVDDVSGAGQPRRHGQLHRVGRGGRQDRVVEARALLGVVRRAHDRGRHRVLRNARGLHQGREHQGRQGALEVQDAVRNHRQRVHVRVRRQAVRRHVFGHRRLGRHRHGGRLDRKHGRPGRRRRLQGSRQVHDARRIAVRVRVARLGTHSESVRRE